MYLKSIEVQGFKSFANKIDFKFHNGITGIVGPNGSGKSNVADAVRWVLGEQRVKQLRGGSMQDVIFSGTELRKPLSSAYVAITLDNSDHQLAIDYDEVTVSRRLYRSNESEYMINGTVCRLKDVNELFYDTGIGKEGYSIIGQGQIDKILSGKPEERRELFDEAAGIVKYKRRKTQAQKKLEDEKNNQVRVGDIISVLEKQVEPLRKQAEKAHIYLNKRENLKKVDVNFFLLDNVAVNDKLKETADKLEIAHNEYDDTVSKFENVKVEYEQVEEQLENIEKEIEESRTTLTDTGFKRTELEGQINVLEEQIKAAEGNEEHLNKRIHDINENIDEKNAEKNTILSKKAEIDVTLSELEEERKSAVSELENVQNEIESLNDSIEDNKNAIIDVLNLRATIKSKIGRFDTILEQLNIQKADVNAKLLKFESEDMRNSEEIKELEEKFDEINEQIEAMKLEQSGADEKLQAIREQMGVLDKKLQDARMRYQQKKSEVEALTNIAQRYEGYNRPTKAVMEQKTHEKGIVGVVADILTTDKEYETAIEIALGGNIQNVVTEDEECAKRLIEFLKKTRGGRVTFLPLTSITNPEEFKKPEALEEKGVIGLADSLVHIEKKYADVAKNLLGRILVVDNATNASKIARKYNYTLRMVTLEGEYFKPGGSISGGAFSKDSNLLGRRREIEELAKKVNELEAEVANIQEEINDKKKERDQLRVRIESLRTQVQNKFIEQNTARLNVENARSKQGQAKVDFEELNLTRADLDKQNSDIILQKEEIHHQLSDSEKIEQDAKEKIEELKLKLDELREIETIKSALVNAKEVETEKIKAKVSFEQANIERIDSEIERYVNELNEVKAGINATADETEFKKNCILELKKTIEASYEIYEAADNKLKENTKKKEELTANQKDFFTKRENLSDTKSRLEGEIYRLESSKEQLENKIEAQKSYLWDEYEITPTEAYALRDPEFDDLTEMKKQIQTLKAEIKGLGEVNVNAIEDYREVSEQYNFMKTQYDDLTTAVESLNSVIEELDKLMREQFTEKFSDINKQFDKVFKELFGGGHGSLELMEDEDILEAGIIITAQPPGKKLVNMMQMSGGEKSLTAIALLFAIQNLKPSPFCLLDEIEAALDESNVSRFADYLHKLTKNTQFIVITHRRGTMEKTDRLYGITMQEKGVSTLVSVNLIDKDLDD